MTPLLGSLLITAFLLVAPNSWIGPQKEPPPVIGEIVAQGHWGPDAPDIEFTVSVTGVVQLESMDNDPKCLPDGTIEDGHIFYLNGEPQMVPASTAPCGEEAEDGLYSYSRFKVKPGDYVSGDTRQDSGHLTIRFATESSLLSALGDRVWFDENKNGLQDVDEKGVKGVKVDLYAEAGVFVKSSATDLDGLYLFKELLPGAYYVEFEAPQDFTFTKYNVDSNNQDAVDSDPLVPWVEVSLSDDGENGTAGQPTSYTLVYTNGDLNLPATNVVISATVPIGTRYIVTGSTTGWSCTNAEGGGICSFMLPTLAANTSGIVTFNVLVDEDEGKIPEVLELHVSLTQGPIGRTQVVTLDPGETDLTVDAGIVPIGTSLQTTTVTHTTDLPPTGQPSAGMFFYLPSVRAEDK